MSGEVSKEITAYISGLGSDIASTIESSFENATMCCESARLAQRLWSTTTIRHRQDIIKKIHFELSASAMDIAKTISQETGRPLQETLGAEILPTLKSLHFIQKNLPRVLKTKRLSSLHGYSQQEPFGVIGIIGTWNYPLFLNLVPIIQAIAMGNSVLWKPSELSYSSSKVIINLLQRAGVPNDIVHILYGDSIVGEILTHLDCDKLVFTGSANTGRKVMSAIAARGIPSVMELSGKDAFIVLEDAPVHLAARSAVWGRLSNGGQSCIAPQRFYVHDKVYDEFIREVIEAIRVIPPAQLTAVRSIRTALHTKDLVRKSIEQGATLCFGTLDNATNLYEPFVLSNCTNEMAIMQEDLFAPVLCIRRVADDNIAISFANDCRYALGASIWSKDLEKAKSLANRLTAGVISINDVLLDAANPEVPFGGMKSSGFGKQRGIEGLLEYSQTKIVCVHSPSSVRRHLFPYFQPAEDLLLAQCSLQRGFNIRELINLIKAALRWQKQSDLHTKQGSTK